MAHYDDELTRRLRHMGDQVRDRRHQLNLSQEQLAESSGLHRTYIGALERGQRNVSMGSLFRVADALNIDAGLLVQEPGK